MELMKGSDDWNVFADIFNLFKKYYAVPKGQFSTNPEVQEYWKKLISDSDDISDKYKDTGAHELANRLVISVINEFEYRSLKENDRNERNFKNAAN